MDDNDIPVQCTRCKNKHMESARVRKYDQKNGMTLLVCPRCSCKSYYNLDPMVAYVWASGLIEIGKEIPEGAIKIAHGPQSSLKAQLNTVARHGYGDSAGKLLLPGIPEAPDQEKAGDALEAFIAWAAKSRTAKKWGVVFTTKEQ